MLHRELKSLHRLSLFLNEGRKPFDLVLDALVNLEAREVEEGESVVVQDLLLGDPGEVGQLEIKLRSELFVHEKFKNI